MPQVIKQALYSRFISEEHALLLSHVQDEQAIAEWIGRIVAERISPDELKDRIDRETQEPETNVIPEETAPAPEPGDDENLPNWLQEAS